MAPMVEHSVTNRRTGRIILYILSLSCFAWAFMDSRFRDFDNFLTAHACLPMSASWALAILGWGVLGEFTRPASWFALAIAGQAVALQMIEAGPLIRYQHYKSFETLFTESNILLIGFVILQAILVSIGIQSRWNVIKKWISDNFTSWQIILVTLIFIVTSTAVSRNVPSYLIELLFAAFIQAVNLANVVLVAWTFPKTTLHTLNKCVRVLSRDNEVEPKSEVGHIDLPILMAALWVSSVAAALSFFVYQHHPHVPDEVIYLYHARYLAKGLLTTPSPPVPEAFSFYLIPHHSERWYSIFPPGWPAILALGVRIGVPWLVNPLLAGLNVILASAFLTQIYSRRIARLTALLLCVSPWYVFMAMSFMSHTSTLSCALLAALGLARSRRREKPSWAWMAGAATGLVSLIRPLDGLLVAGLLGVWALRIGGLRIRNHVLAWFVMGVLTVSGIVLMYNAKITGDPTVFPLTAYYNEYHGFNSNAFGFGPERGLNWPLDPFPGHSPLEALINITLNCFSVNIELFGWSSGSLLILALFACSKRIDRRDSMLFGAIAAVIFVYSFYWYSGGPDFGARYWYLMIIPLAALTVRGSLHIARTYPIAATLADTHVLRCLVLLFLLSLCSLMNYFPWRAIDKYHHYLRMRPDLRQLAGEYGFGKSLVLVRGEAHPDYASAWVYNPLDPYADVPVYAWDRDPETRSRVLRAYLDRPVWIVNGPTVTRRGFEVVAGPLAPYELLSKAR